MNDFYENNEDEIRSKLNNHQFEMKPGAWEDMEKRLNTVSRLNQNTISTVWGSWVFSGLLIATALTSTLLYFYHNHSEKKEIIASNKNNSENYTKEKSQSIISPTSTQNNNQNNQEANAGLSISDIIPPVSTNNNSEKANNNPNQNNIIALQTKKIEEPSIINTSKSSSIFFPEEQSRIFKRKIETTYAYSSSMLQKLNQLDSKKINKINLIQDKPDSSIVFIDNRKNKKNKLRFGLEAGTAVNIANSKIAAAPVAGVFVRKELNRRQAIQADLQYKILLLSAPPGQNEIPVELTSYGTNNSTYERKNAKIQKLSQIHLIELPLSFIHKLNNKHSVSMGVTAAYLCAAGGNYHNSEQHPNSKVVFNKLDLGALTGYTYKISNNLEFTIYCQVGLLNLINNSAIHKITMDQEGEQISIPQEELDKMPEGEVLIPLEMNEDNPGFFQTPEKFYNTDLRMILRYLF